ncbi:hypothetical protein [Parasphaerochaeta coccoides]|uniref:Uncharacterized protein n=1 Tax=Parasphaerochaeta coccoides (strain ATCC BAA-1237 / DSM 17374 / SPN1) TaxID=760011 RepID=F4GJE6_PARC1|nr:hypothetical protein [Parasphaerochaeta coccoides]AEC02211.1 hypothetical protein Spico_0987 [Parasphaerochaeta coccoides DSM 17374]
MNNRHMLWKVGLLVFVVLLTAVACSTVVSITEYVPALVDMGGRSVIAVASTKPYDRSINTPRWVSIPGDWTWGGGNVVSGVEANVKEDVASYATREILRSLSSGGVYTIIRPEVTDAVLNLTQVGWGNAEALKKNGVEALLTSSIDYMDVSETLTSKPIYEYKEILEGGVPMQVPVLIRHDYIITQIATLNLTYTLTDINDGHILATKQIIDKVTQEVEISTNVPVAPSVTPLFQKVVDSFQKELVQQLVPHLYSRSESLMPNKPKNPQAAPAYDMVSKGNRNVAYDIFKTQWDTQGHIPSGYNAAILAYARGDLEAALDLMNHVYSSSGNPQAARVLSAIRSTIDNRAKVNEQIK